ncbi:MAG: hypothetical protein AB7I08_08590 [Thermoleophilia bacterium]
MLAALVVAVLGAGCGGEAGKADGSALSDQRALLSTCGDWLGLSEDDRVAFAEVYVQRLHERGFTVPLTVETVLRTFDVCEALEPSTPLSSVMALEITDDDVG